MATVVTDELGLVVDVVVAVVVGFLVVVGFVVVVGFLVVVGSAVVVGFVVVVGLAVVVGFLVVIGLAVVVGFFVVVGLAVVDGVAVVGVVVGAVVVDEVELAPAVGLVVDDCSPTVGLVSPVVVELDTTDDSGAVDDLVVGASHPGGGAPGPSQIVGPGPTGTVVSVSSANVGSCCDPPMAGSVAAAVDDPLRVVLTVRVGFFDRSCPSSAFEPVNRLSEPIGSRVLSGAPPSEPAGAAGSGASFVTTSKPDPNVALVRGNDTATRTDRRHNPATASVPWRRYSGSA